MSMTERHDKILALNAEGKSDAVIAHEVGMTQTSVSRILRKEGVVREHSATRQGRMYRAGFANQVRELVEKGLTANKITEATGLSHSTLAQIVREHNIALVASPPGRKSTKKDTLLPEATRLWSEGSTQSEISRALDVPLGTLSRWFKDAGVEVRRIERNTNTKHLNFGSVTKAGAKGGKASAASLAPVTCAYCGNEFARTRKTSESRGSRNKFCSIECSSAHRRETSGKSKTYVCETCGAKFSGWTNNPRKYCSKRCYHQSNPTKVGVDGVVLDSWWEAAFGGVAAMIGVTFERTKRAQGVAWAGGQSWYAPDFYLTEENIYVEVKGRVTEDDSAKWAAFRQDHTLAVLSGEALDVLRRSADRNDFLDRLRLYC